MTSTPVYRAAGLAAVAAAACLLAGHASAQDSAPGTKGTKDTPKTSAKATSLGALLNQIEQEVSDGEVEQQKRVRAFEARTQEQVALVDKARAAEAAAVAESERLEALFESNGLRIEEQEVLLKQRMGDLGELFGVVRQVAGDTGALVRDSLVSAELPGRHEFLYALGQSKALPKLGELEKLWLALQQEMTEQGRVVRFEAPVTDAAGQEKTRTVTRVGTFNLVSGGKYLSWLPETRSLIVLPRQPSSRFTGLIAGLERGESGHVAFGVDPSRGSLLSLLVQTPDARERLEAGGVVGYAILALGAVTAVLALLRLIYLLVVSAMVRGQVRSPENPRDDNPLGRVLAVGQDVPGADAETLERQLDEAVLRESSTLERMLWAVKVVSVVAPLMGLLGTVTGMIRTFQQITLFGTGDPKLMAGGISEALVTTMLGLIVAIPLVLMHSVLRSTTRRLGDVLQQQAAGLVAVQARARDRHPTPDAGSPLLPGDFSPAGGE